MSGKKDNNYHAPLIICHGCDALQRVPDSVPGNAVTCIRCGFRLFRRPMGGIDKQLALTLSTMILFIIANVYPILTIQVAGIERSATITETAMRFFHQGSPELAVIVWTSSVLIPGVVIFGLFYVLLSIRLQFCWAYTRKILVWITHLLPWAMMDVYLLSVFVALVKLISLASVDLNEGFYALLFVIYFYAATIASIEPYFLWQQIDKQWAIKRGGAL
jgi:paraquat-inducible protein A